MELFRSLGLIFLGSALPITALASVLQPSSVLKNHVAAYENQSAESAFTASVVKNDLVKRYTHYDTTKPRNYLIELSEPPLVEYKTAYSSSHGKNATAKLLAQHELKLEKLQTSVISEMRSKKLISEVIATHKTLVDALVVKMSPRNISTLKALPNVAIIDTGIDYTHPALGGCFGEGCKVVAGYNFVNEDDDPMDDDGHGTHVAGIVGALSDDLRGVAPQVRLHAYKVLDNLGAGLLSDVVRSL